MARSSGRFPALVGAGILLSRLAGLVRQRVFSHYLGLHDEADVVTAAFRIPNLLQNLFGEGVLSASFIPVYVGLLRDGDEDAAGKVAGAVLGLLSFVVALIVLVGVVATPLVVDTLVPGFGGHKRLLTISVVRILFPATGLLVLSAWCLGILNSHKRFFVSYSAPVIWNIAIIAVTVWAALRAGPVDTLVVWIAWGAVLGSALQVLVQLPTVIAVLKGFKLAVRTTTPEVRTVVRNFWPVLLGRGANQISAYVDGVIASLLSTGANAALGNAQLLYTLPVSLFGMSVAAAELPQMSEVGGSDEQRFAVLRSRLEDGYHKIAFFIVPCAVAFIVLGQVIAGAVFQTGRFSAADSRYVWAILAGSAVGLLASTLSRLTSSTFYALKDTRTPLRYALVRVGLTTVLGFAAAMAIPAALGVETKWGAAGLTATAGFAGWVEFLLLRRRLATVIGPTHFQPGYLPRLWTAAMVGGAIGVALFWRFGAEGARPIATAAVVLIPFGLAYASLTLYFRIPTAVALMAEVRRRAF
ncbi:MAG TPA: murein biosynthesis integral membrane protein MurJ [Gemmatimonadales bacterium]|jgi:putative peptidoglycan lipid II flippase